MIERKINEHFLIEGIEMICVEDKGPFGCNDCVFDCLLNLRPEETGRCACNFRSDHKDVHFINSTKS